MTTTSFYLTPELKAKAINLAFRVNGELEPFVNQTKLIERDPSRGKHFTAFSLLMFVHFNPSLPPFFFFCCFAKVKLHFGGIGLYSSMKDYLTLLRHLLQIKGEEEFHLHFLTFMLHYVCIIAGKPLPNAILSARTVQEIFTPTLPSSAVTSLDLFLSFFGVPPGNQWGTALALRTEDQPESRKKGSAYCTFWWLDSFFHILHPLSSLPLMCLLWQGLVGLGPLDI